MYICKPYIGQKLDLKFYCQYFTSPTIIVSFTIYNLVTFIFLTKDYQVCIWKAFFSNSGDTVI